MRNFLTFVLVLSYSLFGFGSPKLTPLDVKPGLWETKTKVSVSGVDAMLSQIPANFRNQIKEKLLSSLAKDKTETDCIKQEDLDKPSTFNPDGDDCEYKVIESDSSGFESHFSCQGGESSDLKGVLKMKAQSKEELTGNMSVTQKSQMGNINVNVEMTGTFQGSDCKGIK